MVLSYLIDLLLAQVLPEHIFLSRAEKGTRLNRFFPESKDTFLFLQHREFAFR